MGEGLLLWQALGICPGDVVAFTGGGGKTSLALTVVRELRAAGRPVLFTCTTRMFPVPWMEPVLTATAGDAWLEAVAAALAAGRPVCLGQRVEPETGKLFGITTEQVAACRQLRECVVLVEADGSAGLPLKAPAAHEPVIPPVADIVVPVAGAGVLGKALVPANVHRAPLVARLAGVPEGVPVTPEIVAAALVAPDGCTRGAPPGARIVPVVSQADTPDTGPLLRALAQLLLGRAPGRPGQHVSRVVLAAPATAEPVREVIGSFPGGPKGCRRPGSMRR
ncbi:MAG TPA: selenium cofactor biosynthesis protein YqeC [Symbiobacteriaceae bacterium]